MSQAGELNVVQNNPDIPTLFIANVGSAVPVANELEIIGAGGITTTGSGNTITISGTGFSETFTTDSGVASPAASNLNVFGTASQGIFTAGAGSTITLTAANASSVQKGVASFDAINFTATAGNITSNPITITGGSGISVIGSPVNLGGAVTISSSGSVATTYTGNTGSATPALNNLNIVGTGSITTTGAGSTITAALTGLTNHSLLVGAGTPTITNLGVATNGQLPIGSTAADPVLATLSIANGIDVVNGPGSISIRNLRDVGRYVVAPIAGQAGYTSIQTAINQAVTDGANATTPATVWIMSGTYTENLTLAPFVSLACKAVNTATIVGNASFTPSADFDAISFQKVTFTTPIAGGIALSILGVNICFIMMDNCTINGSTGNCFSTNNPNVGCGLTDCIFNASSGFKIFDIISCSSIRAIGCNSTTTDTASTISGASNVSFTACIVEDFFILSGNAFVTFKSGSIVSLATFSCVDIGPTNICAIFDSTIISNATSGYWATGTGSLLYAANTVVIFFSAQQIDPTVNVLNQPLAVRNLSFDGGMTSMVNNGELIIGSSTTHPQISTLTAGPGISIVNGSGSITISSTGSGYTWTDASGGFAAVSQNGYFITATSTATLPATPSQGDAISFIVDTTDILTITANTGQMIRLGTAVSVTGGTCVSVAHGDSVELVYRTVGATWLATSSLGTWIVT